MAAGGAPSSKRIISEGIEDVDSELLGERQNQSALPKRPVANLVGKKKDLSLDRGKTAHREEGEGILCCSHIYNDGTPNAYRWLLAIKYVVQKQLPNMPREYISRLVFNRNHETLFLVRGGKEVVACLTFRPFPSQGFVEIVFLAVNAIEQGSGYGSHMMNHFKRYMQQSINAGRNGILHFLTYADNDAIGYFKKMGFSRRIRMPRDTWAGHIKHYEGGTLMHCLVSKQVNYLTQHAVLNAQKNAVLDAVAESSPGSGLRYHAPGFRLIMPEKPKGPVRAVGCGDADAKEKGKKKRGGRKGDKSSPSDPQGDQGPRRTVPGILTAEQLKHPQFPSGALGGLGPEALLGGVNSVIPTSELPPGMVQGVDHANGIMYPLPLSDIPGLAEVAPELLASDSHGKKNKGPWSPSDVHEDTKVVMEQIVSSSNAWPFKDAVNAEQVTDYLDIVRNPVDLSVIQMRHARHYYQTREHFIADVEMMLQNCKSYNDEKTPYFKAANALGKQLRDFSRAQFPEANIPTRWVAPTPAR